MAVSNLGTGGGGFQVSPGINISEIDLTTVIPAVSSTVGAIGGVFRWGPVGKYLLIDSENTLAARYGKPTDFNAETWFTAANFLAYAGALYVSRAADTTAVFNAVANSSSVTVANQVVKNDDDYTTKTFDPAAHFVAKYPGALGNSLKVSAVFNANQYQATIDATAISTVSYSINTGSSSMSVVCGDESTADASDLLAANTIHAALSVGDYLLVGNNTIGTQYLKVKTIGAVTQNTSAVSKQVTATIANASANATLITLTTGNTSGFNTGDTVTAASNTAVVNTDITLSIASVVNSTAFTVNAAAVVANGVTSLTLTDADGEAQTAFFTVSFTDSYKLGSAFSGSTVNRYWEYFNQVDSAPGQSDFVAAQGNTAAQDEVHIVITDEGGQITGNPGQILEVFQSLSRATDAKKTGVATTNYWKSVVNDFSQYIWGASDISGAISNTALNIASATGIKPSAYRMAGGTDGDAENTAAPQVILDAYNLFKDKEIADISLIMAGKSRGGLNGELIPNYIIDNIATVRKDCIVFVSPEYSDVVNNVIDPSADITTFRDSLRSTSFAVLDSGYKYQYDKYNDIYRWIPLNGDIAGVCARTDQTNDPWFSPAGYNRGQIKNVVKLAFNPSQAERDVLYKKGVNPVVTFPGQGTILYGDKTLQAKPSAFDRINVRRLFIVLEKAVAAASKFSLFEFNDEFTRAQFKNLVEPYLRDIQGRNGIYDYRVVCDESNNTSEVVDSQRFVGDIYIKPARSINYIQLNFVAVRSGVEFSEVVGQI